VSVTTKHNTNLCHRIWPCYGR